MANKDVQFTLSDGVDEVLGTLTGLDLSYQPEMDRFQAITRALNRSLRMCALEHEWSYYTTDEDIGLALLGSQTAEISPSLRPRAVGDDTVRLCDDAGIPIRWAFFLPRDALSKYIGRTGLWVSWTRSTLTFSRPFWEGEAGLHIVVPCMREPRMFVLPKGQGQVPARILNQPIDFDYPDLVVARAAHLYAQSDPIMQPRVQTLEAAYKDIMYQLIERDDRFTDSPYLNEFTVPIQNGVNGGVDTGTGHFHPHSDERRV